MELEEYINSSNHTVGRREMDFVIRTELYALTNTMLSQEDFNFSLKKYYITTVNRGHFTVTANKVVYNEQYVHEEVQLIDREAFRIQITDGNIKVIEAKGMPKWVIF